MRHLRRAFPITIGLATAAACALLACGDDDTAVTPTPDGSTLAEAGKTDTGTPADSGGGNDTGTGIDTGTDTGVDAGPNMTATLGSTGDIFVGNDIVTASFFEDDTILHWSNAPSCVAFVRGGSKPPSQAGTIKVAGDVVGKDGGPDSEVEVAYDPSMGYFAFVTAYPPVDTYTASVQITAAQGFAPMPAEVFRPSRETPIVITSPSAPDADVLAPIPSTAPYTIAWTAPTGGFVNEQVISVSIFASGSSALTAKNTHLYCTFPLSAGTGTIPANVLTELRTRAGASAGTAVDAKMHIHSGGAKEVKVPTGSYFVEVVRVDSTTIANDNNVKIQ